MKIGDKVKIHDGSWAMVSDNEEVLRDICGTVLISDGSYEVLDIGCFDAQTEQNDYGEVNDIKLRCVKNPDRIVYTQMRFCSIV